MKIPNKKEIYSFAMWCGIITCYLLTLNTFIKIFLFGKITYQEPNYLILTWELIMVLILGLMLIPKFIKVFKRIFLKEKEINTKIRL